MSDSDIPSEINLKKQSKILRIVFQDKQAYEFSFEYLRVHSPSAEVRGHGSGDAVLQVGKENIAIDDIEPVGNYAIKLKFSDGHDTGLYSWSYLRELGVNMDSNWSQYLKALETAGHKRENHE